MFPISLPNLWLKTDCLSNSIAADAQDWITTESSLTIRVKELGIAFSLEVLNQSQVPLSSSQQKTLCTKDTSALVREVLLKQANIPVIYAQTIMPISTVTGTEKMLAELGDQPLGQVLFQSPQATRGEIEFSEVTENSDLGQYIKTVLKQESQTKTYIRRSQFQLNHKPLLVCECFLPALFTTKKINET